MSLFLATHENIVFGTQKSDLLAISNSNFNGQYSENLRWIVCQNIPDSKSIVSEKCLVKIMDWQLYVHLKHRIQLFICSYDVKIMTPMDYPGLLSLWKNLPAMWYFPNIWMICLKFYFISKTLLTILYNFTFIKISAI